MFTHQDHNGYQQSNNYILFSFNSKIISKGILSSTGKMTFRSSTIPFSKNVQNRKGWSNAAGHTESRENMDRWCFGSDPSSKPYVVLKKIADASNWRNSPESQGNPFACKQYWCNKGDADGFSVMYLHPPSPPEESIQIPLARWQHVWPIVNTQHCHVVNIG